MISEALTARVSTILERAAALDITDPLAMSVATADPQGRPSVRTVLLKHFDARGFVFYTNTESRKGAQLAANPYAALVLFWRELYLQIHAEGQVEVVSAAEADAYWATRPRASQIGGVASAQSRELASREALAQRVAVLETEYAGREVPRPPHWSGYRVVPQRIEIWSGAGARLHDRELFEWSDGEWRASLLYP